MSKPYEVKEIISAGKLDETFSLLYGEKKEEQKKRFYEP